MTDPTDASSAAGGAHPAGEDAGAGAPLVDPRGRQVSLRKKHLLEAATATGWESGHQIEVQLGHYCNNRCVFCVSGQLTEEGHARPIPEEPVLRALEEAAARGVRRVTFLGGEPTIQRSFLPALRRAVALGFDDVVIFTNGARGTHGAWLDEVLALGRFTWRVSIQGGTREAHEAATGRRRSWDRIVAALEHLSARGQDITANMCVNERSYRSLPELPALVRRYGIRQVHIDMVRPENAGTRTDAYLRDIMPRHTAMQPYLAAMLERFEAWDPSFDVNLGNYPTCLLPAWSHRIHHGGEPTLTLTTGHRGELDTILRKYAYQRVDAVYAPGCEGCVFRPDCRGVPELYAAYYGTDELRPVTRDALAALDPRQRAFPTLAAPWIDALLAATPPDGWALTELHRDARERRVTLGAAHGSGRRATLLLTPAVDPPAGSPAPVLATDRFALAVVPAGAPAEAEVALARWASAVVAAVPGARVLRGAGRKAAAARIGALAARLRGWGGLGAWRVADGGAAGDGEARAVRLLGPEGRGLAVFLEPREGGRGVRVRFDLDDGTPPEAAREVIEAVSARLRG